MSDLDAMLTSSDPLETFDRHRLEDWLAVLEEDVAVFGLTPQDERRMSDIRRRLAQANGEPKP